MRYDLIPLKVGSRLALNYFARLFYNSDYTTQECFTNYSNVFGQNKQKIQTRKQKIVSNSENKQTAY